LPFKSVSTALLVVAFILLPEFTTSVNIKSIEKIDKNDLKIFVFINFTPELKLKAIRVALILLCL
jgi:hypothetical protein